MEPLAVTVTRLREAPNDRTAFVTLDAAARLAVVPAVDGRDRVPRSAWLSAADAAGPPPPGRSDDRRVLRVSLAS
jgi:hypothetical protein